MLKSITKHDNDIVYFNIFINALNHLTFQDIDSEYIF